MRKYRFSFFLCVFAVLLPFGFAFGASKTTYNGVKGTSYNIVDGKGSLAGGCDGNKKAGDDCDSAGASKAICVDFKGKLSCAAKVCREGYLLELNEKGTSKGICRTEKFAKDNCRKSMKQRNEICPENQEASPIRKKNPNTKYSDDDRAYNECFCADKSNLKYECGEGATGKAPVVTQTFMNTDSITVAGRESCEKTASTFNGWRCSDDNNNTRDLKEGQVFNIEEKTTCVAQWVACPACNPGNGCDCSVRVENNECKYATSVKSGYKFVNGQGSATPVCELIKKCPAGATGTPPNCKCGDGKKYNPETNTCESICNTDIATWKGGKCQCNEAGKIYNEETSTCDCPSEKPLYENGQCMAPKKCPAGATGTPPNCKCSDGENYNPETNTCESICNTDIATWKGGKCQCKEEGKIYNEETSTCDCPPEKPTYENGKCIMPAKCPEGTTGTPPQCICTDESTKYNSETNTCESICNKEVATWKDGKCQCKEEGKIYNEETSTCDCPPEKPTYENGQCIVPTKCPEGATGTPPNCSCPDGQEYNASTNTCGSICNEAVAILVDGKCICKEEGYIYKNGTCVEDPKKKIKEKEKAYKDAKDKEQSKENRTLTALTVAATGIGGMELAMGLSQQSADKEADQNMDAYIETFRCTYGHGKQVKAGIEEIELPGGNDMNLMNYRSEYLALAASLKERKTALDMKPGIEAETIIDKATSGLYDDENIGITGGAYSSLYRAKMLASEKDQANIDEERKASKNRVIAGATLVGVGVVGGMLGDSLINGKLGEKIKERKEKKKLKETSKKEYKEWEIEQNVTNEKTTKLYECIKKEVEKDNKLSETEILKKCEGTI